MWHTVVHFTFSVLIQTLALINKCSAISLVVMAIYLVHTGTKRGTYMGLKQYVKQKVAAVRLSTSYQISTSLMCIYLCVTIHTR